MKELHLTDNLTFLKYLYKKGLTSFIDLIYIDPPFNSKRNYNIIFDAATKTSEIAFSDIWSNVSYLDELEEINTISPNLYNFLRMLEQTGLPKSYISYLTAMAIRCWYMRHTLKDTGSFVYHCDPTAGHYIKVMLDYIFGMENVLNEIVWFYPDSPGRSNKYFPWKHDTLFIYSKNKDDYYFDDASVREEILEASKERYKSIRKIGGKEYLGGEASTIGKLPESVWRIPVVKGNSEQSQHYPTQKPEALLERVVKALSPENGVVADFYMGGGTTLAVAERLGRQWIGSDINYRAIQITKERVEKLGCILTPIMNDKSYTKYCGMGGFFSAD